MKQAPLRSKPAFVAGIFFCAFLTTAWGEDLPERHLTERVSVDMRILPFSDLRDPPIGTPHEHLQIQPEEIRARYSFEPIRFSERKAVLTPSISYEQLHFNYHNWNSQYEPYRVDTLQSIGLGAYYRQPMRKPLWSFGFFFSGGLASDFKAITWSDVRVQGGGFVSRKVYSGSLSFGAALLDTYGQPRVFPVIGFEPDPEAVHKVTIRLPVEMSYFYCPLRKPWEIGATARVSGLNAHLEEPGVFQNKNAGYSVATVGPSVHWKIMRLLMLTIDAGWAPYQRFDILDRTEQLRSYDLKSTYFVSTGLRLSL